jgi:Transglutaminase-like superfamily
MRTALLLLFILLAQTLFAQKMSVQYIAKSDSAFVFTIIQGKTDTVEAIFKWVAENISYDVPRMNDKNRGVQTVAQTLRTRKGVCSDYTDLLNAFYKKAGYEVEKITGYTIDIYGVTETKDGHAWTALKDKNTWYLLDATWAAGYVSGDVFTKEYDAQWYKMPAAEFVKTHIPHDPLWRIGNPKRHAAIRQAMQQKDSVALLKDVLRRMQFCDETQKQNPLYIENVIFTTETISIIAHNTGLEELTNTHKILDTLQGIVNKGKNKSDNAILVFNKNELKNLQKRLNLSWNKANRLFLNVNDRPLAYIAQEQAQITAMNNQLKTYFMAETRQENVTETTKKAQELAVLRAENAVSVAKRICILLYLGKYRTQEKRPPPPDAELRVLQQTMNEHWQASLALFATAFSENNMPKAYLNYQRKQINSVNDYLNKYLTTNPAVRQCIAF